ncbi:hypothetical protein CDD82_959 [Ophiocordyceps australis]|uniref:Uncharacterized protein n=1 Tax=Ophiocordyceps australis TaxID=1399860 RepID=A0A2C5YKZ0_9HYPO|nr:hypothetical protein CDD82_959 [Ophiocordyceps australis]
MAVTLPQVEPVALKVKPELQAKSADINVTNDYGTPNLLFLYYVPFLPDDKKLDLDAIQDEFQTWSAWELGQAETQLMKHVEGGRLPSDDSIASRVLRNNYRSKAIAYFRETSEAWLSSISQNLVEKSVPTTPDNINGAILSVLRTLHLEQQLQIPFRVVLNTISGTVDLDKESKYFFTHVFYQYNHQSRTFQPIVLDTTFTFVNPADAQGESSKPNLTLQVNFAVSKYQFDRNLWRRVRHEGEEAIEMGRSILKDMSFDFYVTSPVLEQ